MSGLEIFLWLFALLLFKPMVDEIWTLMQIIKSFFVSKVNLKVEYGDWAVVTGCTDGIGKAYAFQLAKRGINIVLISRNPDKLQQVAADIESKHEVKTKIIVADFAEGQKVYKNIRERLTDVEVGILVNNVGMFSVCPKFIREMSEKEVQDYININIAAATLMTQMVLPGMVKRGRGAIVNMSSITKLLPMPLGNIYSASKIFLDYYTDALRREHWGSNLTFQCLCPFFVSTKFLEFSEKIQEEGIFTPNANKYANCAVDTLGIIDNTTAYWPHRLQYLIIVLVPIWFRTIVCDIVSRSLRRQYLKKNSSGKCL